MKEINHLVSPDVDGTVILKLILENQGVCGQHASASDYGQVPNTFKHGSGLQVP
jgi:hypothetical protein